VRDDLATLLSERFAARASVPEPSSTSRRPHALPVGLTSLIGRERVIGEVDELLARQDVRLVTLTGPGGIGKTRLALAVAERVAGRFAAGTVFVPLAAVTDASQMFVGVSRALGADLRGAGAPLEALTELLGDVAWLLILDNLEQITGAAGAVDEVLARCRGVMILATSRAVLRLRAEWEYPVSPLPLPPDADTVPPAELASAPAVALFLDRARVVRPDFALTDGNALAVAATWSPRCAGT